MDGWTKGQLYARYIGWAYLHVVAQSQAACLGPEIEFVGNLMEQLQLHKEGPETAGDKDSRKAEVQDTIQMRKAHKKQLSDMRKVAVEINRRALERQRMADVQKLERQRRAEFRPPAGASKRHRKALKAARKKAEKKGKVVLPEWAHKRPWF